MSQVKDLLLLLLLRLVQLPIYLGSEHLDLLFNLAHTTFNLKWLFSTATGRTKVEANCGAAHGSLTIRCHQLITYFKLVHHAITEGEGLSC